MNSKRHWLTSVSAIAVMLIVACSSPPERTPPKFTGRLLFLNGSGGNGADLIELVAGSDGTPHNLGPIASGVFEATTSADQNRVLFATKDEIMLRDLGSRATTSVLKGQSYCLTWAPDGKHFSYKQKTGAKSTKLYVSDLEGKNKLIWEDTSGLESAQSQCGQWIDPDRIVFDRFVGMILKNAIGQSLKPNTSTIATVTESVKFVDSPRKVSVRAACPSGTVFLTPADEPNPMQIATSVDRLDKLSTVPGPSEGVFIGFAAKSCVPFFVSQSLSTTTDVFSLSPPNWQRSRSASIQHTFSPNARFLIGSSARLMIAGDAPNRLLLIDTESGDFTKLAPSTMTILSPVPIVWIENRD